MSEWSHSVSLLRMLVLHRWGKACSNYIARFIAAMVIIFTLGFYATRSWFNTSPPNSSLTPVCISCLYIIAKR